MIPLIITYQDECGGEAEYAPMVIIIKWIDRLVDICNNTGMSNKGVFKGCEPIDQTTHKHLKELLDIDWNCSVNGEMNQKMTKTASYLE